MTGSTHGLTTPRKADWRDAGLCRQEDPELFFPKGYEGPWQLIIDDAKAVCRRCPSQDNCLNFALDENIGYGIFGGLTDKERANLRRRAVRAAARKDDIEEARRPNTLLEAWKSRTEPLEGGHLGWTGNRQVAYGGVYYTPKRAAFIADRDLIPEGHVLAMCEVQECVLPAHLTDARERKERGLADPRRAVCGTRSAYSRHVRNGEPIDDACRAANTDADNRLRRTGTTKANA